MAERFPRNAADPLALILAMGLQEIARRRAEERAARRAKLSVVDGAKRGGQAA